MLKSSWKTLSARYISLSVDLTSNFEKIRLSVSCSRVKTGEPDASAAALSVAVSPLAAFADCGCATGASAGAATPFTSWAAVSIAGAAGSLFGAAKAASASASSLAFDLSSCGAVETDPTFASSLAFDLSLSTPPLLARRNKFSKASRSMQPSVSSPASTARAFSSLMDCAASSSSHGSVRGLIQLHCCLWFANLNVIEASSFMGNVNSRSSLGPPKISSFVMTMVTSSSSSSHSQVPSTFHG
mmetsp:Transcript_4360/g.8725  ORF Transcript_4360/g.8725 Transcript_4360/m.8725 type:complete len:243 (+) Transcript_4360:116-844(+)